MAFQVKLTVRLILQYYFSLHILLILIVLLVLGSAHVYKKPQRGRDVARCKSDLSKCIAAGGSPCLGTGYSIRCYYYFDRCDGKVDCPWGDDENFCRFSIRPTTTTFITTTVITTRIATATATTTTTSTVSSTSSRSTTSTHTFTNTNTATATVTSSTFTSTTRTPTFSLAQSSSITIGMITTSLPDLLIYEFQLRGAVITGGSICTLMVAGPMDNAMGNDFYLVRSTPTLFMTVSLTATCLPSATTIRI